MHRLKNRRLLVSALASAALVVGCSSDGDQDTEDEPTEEATEEVTETEPADDTEDEPAVEEEPAEEAADDEPESEEAPETEGDVEGEEPGVVLLSEPVTHSENGLELEVDAVRIISIEELEDTSGEDIASFLEDGNAVTFVGMRVTMRNTTDQAVDWYPGGSGSAIVLAGQQGGPNFLGDWGDTLRANAELELNVYYESRVPVEEARAAGELVWDVGSAHDENFDTLTDPELTISYSY